MERFMPDASIGERLEVLRTNATSIERREYYMPLTEEDIQARMERFTENSIFIEDEKEKNKELNDAHRELIKPKVQENSILRNEIKTKQEKRTGNVFELVDYEEGKMKTYNEDGDLLSERRLRPDERKQLNVFSQRGGSRMFMQTGTND